MLPEELNAGTAELLRRVRKAKGVTIERMAAALDVDVKTYKKYEAGISAPRVPDMIRMYDDLGHNALRSVLDMVYPEIYDGLSDESAPDELRAAGLHYFEHIASDREIRTLHYMIMGDDGSNWRPKLELFLKESHLSLRSRIIVLDIINELYEFDRRDGLLVGTDHIKHDEAVIQAARNAAKQAYERGETTYSTALF